MVSIDPTGTALLVMDFLNDMVHPDGKFAEQGWPVQERQTIENAARVVSAARDADLEVIHVRVGWRPGHPDANRDAPLRRQRAAES